MKKLAIAAALIASLTACTTTKDWAATGGSKADGVIRLSYEMAEFETVQVNEYQAVHLATQRCASWGYTGAEAFGGTTRNCVQPGGFGGCARWAVTKEYQCTGESNKGPAVQVKQEAYVIPGWNGSN